MRKGHFNQHYFPVKKLIITNEIFSYPSQTNGGSLGISIDNLKIIEIEVIDNL